MTVEGGNMRDVETVQNELLVALAQAVLTLHQVHFVPDRLRKQITGHVADLEALTQDYARKWPPPDTAA
jgi:hypothetical protein